MKTRLIRCAHLLLCTVLIGAATGSGAIILHYLLDIMQELTFGHTEAEHSIVTDHSDTVRRVLVLITVGVAVSIIWFLLQRRTKLVSIKAADSRRNSAVAPPGISTTDPAQPHSDCGCGCGCAAG